MRTGPEIKAGLLHFARMNSEQGHLTFLNAVQQLVSHNGIQVARMRTLPESGIMISSHGYTYVDQARGGDTILI